MIINYLRTKWNEPCGYKEILDLAWPLILSTCSITIQQFINRIFLSWYSPETLAAAAPAGALSFLAIGLFIGIVNYSSTFIAQYHGAGMKDRIASCVWQSIYLSIVFSIMVLPILPHTERLFHLTGHSPELVRLESSYFNIMIAGAFFSICGAAVSGFFMGLGKTRALLIANIIATCVNIILDYGLIFGKLGIPRLGITGAAYATIIAMATSLIILTCLLFAKENRQEYHIHHIRPLDFKLAKRMVRFGFPNGIQVTIDVFVWSLFLLFVGRLGTIPLAATNLAFQINSVSFMPVTGIGSAVAIIVARELGKNNVENAIRSTISAIQIGAVYNAIIAILYVGVPVVFVYPFTYRADPSSAHELYKLSAILLRFLAAYTVADSISIVFASALRGAGDVVFVMFTFLILGLGCMAIPIYYAVQPGGGGLIWAWTYATIYIFLLLITFFLRFRQGRWKTMRVIEQPSFVAE